MTGKKQWFFQKKDPADKTEHPRKKKDKGREMVLVTYAFLILFLVMIGYLVWYVAARSDRFINNPYNSKRIDAFAGTTVRGDITDRNGVVLAETKTNADGTETRVYPKANRYAHVVGYTSNGKMGVEQLANYYLLRSHANPILRLKNSFSEEKDPGDTCVTTLSDEVQAAAYEALGSYRGAIIAMNPETGEVLCCVSKPDFDPNEVEWTYETLASSDNGVLLDRASQGRYPPGSTFKIVTTLEYLREHPEDAENFHFTCDGIFTSDGKDIHCYHNTAHGEEDLVSAFADSCNGAYAKIGLALDPESFQKTADRMFFDKAIVCDLPTEKPKFELTKDASEAARMETAIGQGKTYVTPLQMLLIVSAVENGGAARKPFLLKEIRNTDGKRVETFYGKKLRRLMSEEEAKELEGYMRRVVTEGTAKALQSDRFTAYGKTGTAEYDDEGNSHAWFVGYARAEDIDPIALAVILEGAGSGSAVAVPAARNVLESYFR